MVVTRGWGQGVEHRCLIDTELPFCEMEKYWLISLSTMSSRFIYVWCVRISFLLKAEWYSTVWMDHFSFIHSLPTGNLGCFHFLVAVNNAALDIGIQITLFFLFSLPLSPSPSF